jgi:hypothetical protein
MIDAGIGANSASGGYDIDNSVKLEADNTEYFSRTPSSNSNRQNFTFSTWVKRTELGQNARLIDAYQDGQNFFTLGFDTSDRLVLYNIDSSVDYGGHYSQRFRDTSAWYHIVFRSETTSSTATTRWKIYVNGVEITAKDTDYGTPPRWYQSNLNSTISHKVGYNTDGSNGSSQYMAETHLVDGTSLLPTSFGEFDEDSGIWKPIEVEDVTYGTNGFYLDYTDGSDLGNDANGSNNFAENNLTAADQAFDTPTNNFCTLNPLYNCSTVPMTDGNTNCDRTDNGNSTVRGTFVVTSGKWYWEVHVGKGSINSNYPFSGMTGNLTLDPCTWVHQDAQTFSVSGSGNVTDVSTHRGTGTAAATSNATPAYSIYGLAVDIDNQTLLWYTNGVANNSGNTYSIANSVSASTEGMTPMVFLFTGAQQSFNFGGYSIYLPSSAQSDANGYGNFEYAPPAGYYALCTKNLAKYGG